MSRTSWLVGSVVVVLSIAVGAASAIADNPLAGATPVLTPAPPGGSSGVTIDFVPGPDQGTASGLRYLQPFPVVRVTGSSVKGGAYIRILSVTAPSTASIQVTCTGSGCPTRRVSPPPGRITQFERFLRAGVVITIRVTRASFIGKYVRFEIRSHAAPQRRDACLLPGSTKPVSCPA